MNAFHNKNSKNIIFVHNIPFKLTREDIIEYFSSHAGDIFDIYFPSKNHNPSKGNPGKCFIQFKDELSVSNAIKLNGQCILGQPIYISNSSPSIRNDNLFTEKYIIPRGRFQTIRHEQRSSRYDDFDSDFDEKSGRFKGGYLLSEEFSDYCLERKKVRPITYEVQPVFPNLLSSLLHSPSISA